MFSELTSVQRNFGQPKSLYAFICQPCRSHAAKKELSWLLTIYDGVWSLGGGSLDLGHLGLLLAIQHVQQAEKEQKGSSPPHPHLAVRYRM